MATSTLLDLVVMTVSSAFGISSTIPLGSAATVGGVTFLSFAGAGATGGNQVSYSILDTGNSEIGIATYTSSNTTLTGRTPTQSTNGGAAITASSAALIYATLRGEDLPITQAAGKTDQETGTSSTLAVTPLHQQSHDSAAKAWVTFGSTGNVLSSYNVASVTRASAGIYNVAFTTVMASSNYVVHVATEVQGNSSEGLFPIVETATKTSSQFQVRFLNQAVSAAVDPNIGHVTVFGRQ